MRQPVMLSLFVAACFGLGSCFGLSAQAQERQEGINMDSLKTVKLSPARLKAFEGYYEFPPNKEMIVQFKVVRDSLVARLLWNDFETPIVPVSDTSFVTVKTVGEGERHLPVSFIKNKKGVYSQIRVFGDEPWNLVKDYKPIVKKEIELTPGQLKVFEGLYEIEENRGLFLQVAKKNNGLVVRRYWNDGEDHYVPDSAMHFFSKEQQIMTLQFIKDSSGNIVQMVAFGNNRWNKRNQVHFTRQQLKPFEGKYRFKDDHDNIIRITATDSGLVVKQLWDGKEVALEQKSEMFFYCQSKSYPLYFTKDKDGAIIQALLLNDDVFERVEE
jgi:hypothetical protein